MRRNGMRPVAAAVAALIIVGAAAPAMAINDTLNMVFNVLLPGRGQAQRGLYTKAAVLGGVTVAGYVGLYSSQLNYNRSVEAYDGYKSTYEGYRTSLDNGVPVPWGSITTTSTNMNDAWNEANYRYNVRNAWIGLLAVTYTLNIIDLFLSEKETGEISEPAEASSMTVGRTADGFMVYKTINF